MINFKALFKTILVLLCVMAFTMLIMASSMIFLIQVFLIGMAILFTVNIYNYFCESDKQSKN